MKIKLCLFISVLCMNTAWAAAADSTGMAPGSSNSGVVTNNAPLSSSWARMIDRSTCSWQVGGGGTEYINANFNDSSSTSWNINVQCGVGYVAIATRNKSSVVNNASGIGIKTLHVYSDVLCCPFKWYQVDQSFVTPASTTVTQPAALPTDSIAPDN